MSERGRGRERWHGTRLPEGTNPRTHTHARAAMFPTHLPDDRGDVRRAAVADGHRGVLLLEQGRCGYADDVRASEDDGLLSVDGDLVTLQQLNAALNKRGVREEGGGGEGVGEKRT